MKIPIEKAYFADNIDFGRGEYAKTAAANPQLGVALWFVGFGVLVEKKGYPDSVVPLSAVRKMEAKGGFDEAIHSKPPAPAPARKVKGD